MMEAPRVHVGILLRTEVRLCLKGSFVCNKRKIEAGAYTVRCEKGTIDSPWGTHQESLELMPASDTSTFILRNVRIGIGFHWEREEDQEFEGSLVLKAEVGAIRAINILPVEQYLKSVISSEMSAMNDPNLLKVHAIVSRSWLLAQMKKKALPHTSLPERQKQENNEIIRWYEREDHATFDVCADDHCQRYQGISKILSANAGKAVDATSGIVLTYNGEICDARFSKCCGGISESYENVWQPISIPYLTSVRDWFPDKSPKNLPVDYFTSSPPAFCNTRDPEVLRQILVDFDRDTQQFYRWKVDYTQEYLSDLLARKSGIDFGRVLDLLPLERGPSGRIIRLKIVGEKQTMIVGKELEIRRWLSESHLYSSAFEVEKIWESNSPVPVRFIFHGAGWGHGVGMCQIGAAVMAREGYTPEQILTHYYPGSRLEKMY